MPYEFREDDWKTFRRMVPIWQERYVSALVGEYVRMLLGKGRGCEKFWTLKKRINEDAKKMGVQIEYRKMFMVRDLIILLNEGVISMNDLDEFSEELRNHIQWRMDTDW